MILKFFSLDPQLVLPMLGPEVVARRQDHQEPEEAAPFVKERPQQVELEQDQQCHELEEQVLEACGDFTPTILQELKCKLTKVWKTKIFYYFVKSVYKGEEKISRNFC